MWSGNRLLYALPLTLLLPRQPLRLELISPSGNFPQPLSAGEPLRSHLPANPTVRLLSFRPFHYAFSPPPFLSTPPYIKERTRQTDRNQNDWQISLMSGAFYRWIIVLRLHTNRWECINKKKTLVQVWRTPTFQVTALLFIYIGGN